MTTFLQILFYFRTSEIGREKRAGGLSSLLCVAVYGLGSFVNGKRREALKQELASHKLSHTAPLEVACDQQIIIYANYKLS